MSQLPLTEALLGDYQANQWPVSGSHTYNEVADAISGLVIGEALYDPVKHLPTAINPFSLMEMALDEPHVLSVLPAFGLEVNVVVDRTSKEEDPRFTRAKLSLADKLTASIERALPGFSDRQKLYVLGDTSQRSYDRDIEYVAVEASESGFTTAVADICVNGLNFVISDFYSLRKSINSSKRFNNTVGIKVNHPFELALPANVGTIALGGAEEVNTSKRRELKRKNDSLQTHHAKIITILDSLGVFTANVVYDPQHPSGLRFDEADRQIAAALTGLEQY